MENLRNRLYEYLCSIDPRYNISLNWDKRKFSYSIYVVLFYKKGRGSSNESFWFYDFWEEEKNEVEFNRLKELVKNHKPYSK